MHAASPPLRARLVSFSSVALLLSTGAAPVRACPPTHSTCRRLSAKTSPGINAFGFSDGVPSRSTKMPAQYRHDGVRIQHDTHAPGMAEKYGTPGNTDSDGFDPYADSVGAGIYSGTVKRRPSDGGVVIGEQYQNHNKKPGPVYSGGGYTPVSKAIAVFFDETRDEKRAQDDTTLGVLLREHPDLVNDVATGGATPLHTCGMSRKNQFAAAYVISKGGDIEALDTYGYTPLDRMASNNLALGASALLRAGADPTSAHGNGEGALKIAAASEARDALTALETPPASPAPNITSLRVFSRARPEVDGTYVRRNPSAIPVKFAAVCEANGWDALETWKELNGGFEGVWFAHGLGESANPSYVYRNAKDGCWWIDGPDGLGVYKSMPAPPHAPPGASIRWRALDGEEDQPALAVFRG
jgi:ankyrin repeat protein